MEIWNGGGRTNAGLFNQYSGRTGENSAPGELSRVGPVVHDSSANEQIVLMVIRAVIESSEVIVDLDDANGEMSIEGDIDAPAEMRGKLRPAIRDAGFGTRCMRNSNKKFAKWLRFVFAFQPWLREFVTPADQVGGESQRIAQWRCAPVVLCTKIRNGSTSPCEYSTIRKHLRRSSRSSRIGPDRHWLEPSYTYLRSHRYRYPAGPSLQPQRRTIK